MDGADKVVVAGMLSVLTLLLALILSSTYESALVARAIAGGAEPIAARCAITGVGTNEALCLVAVQTGQK